MRRKTSSYVFSKKEIRILHTVASGSHSLSALRNSLRVKPSLLSHYLKTLQRKGILEASKPDVFRTITKDKHTKKIYFQNTKHASVLKDLLIKDEHIKWENILSGIGIDILFQILNNAKAPLEKVSHTTSWRYLRILKSTGIIECEEDTFRFNARFNELVSFLEEYQRFITREIVRSVSEVAAVLWQKNFEALIQVPKTVQVTKAGFMKTATSCFAEYGLQLISDFDIYFYSTEKKMLRIEDVILHTLLIGKNSARYTTYCLLLMQKNYDEINQEYFINEAARLGLTGQVNALLQFLKTKGAYTDLFLPTWGELVDKMNDYGVVDSWSVVHSPGTM